MRRPATGRWSGKAISPSTITRLTEVWREKYAEWTDRGLGDRKRKGIIEGPEL